MRFSRRHCLTLLSVLLMGLLVAAWGGSYWRSAGRGRSDETWVITGGMQELHTRARVVWIVRGRFEAVETEVLSAVIPAGSSAKTEPRHEASWIWRNTEAERVRSWESRWRMSNWNEWRLGDLGWYHTTGGGSTARVVSVPLWMLIVLAGAPFWIRLARAVRSMRRMAHGKCVACGYDRRGLAPTASCPECGQVGDEEVQAHGLML